MVLLEILAATLGLRFGKSSGSGALMAVNGPVMPRYVTSCICDELLCHARCDAQGDDCCTDLCFETCEKWLWQSSCKCVSLNESSLAEIIHLYDKGFSCHVLGLMIGTLIIWLS